MLHSVIKCPILSKGDEGDLDIPVRNRIDLDQLHCMTGSFQKLHKCCKAHFPSIEKWAMENMEPCNKDTTVGPLQVEIRGGRKRLPLEKDLRFPKQF